jgi:crotonobetainyl-CoA:carnitine CoA-transferase CaiB-like acyl-CoA transferase
VTPITASVLGDLGIAQDSYIDNKARLARRTALIERLCALSAKFPRAELLAKLEAAGVPAGPINDLEQVFADPQVVHRGMRLDRPSAAAEGGTIPGVRTPIMLDGAPMAAEHPSPRLGEHTAEILRKIGE